MILIINTCDKDLPILEEEFVRPVVDVVKENSQFSIVHYEDLKESNLTNCDRVIVCGTALKDNKFMDDIEKFSWIENFEKPLLGICAGSQIIAKVFGSELREGVEIGLNKIEVVSEDEVLNGVDLKEVYSMHSFCFDKPEGFEVIAKKDYPQIIKKDRIYGVLFHPEARTKKIIENFVTL